MPKCLNIESPEMDESHNLDDVDTLATVTTSQAVELRLTWFQVKTCFIAFPLTSDNLLNL